MNQAQTLAALADKLRHQPGDFDRRTIEQRAAELGARCTYDSNDGERDRSFSPTRHYRMPDGSRLEVGYSGAWTL